jgi:CRISPR/Cas system-associated exonuclease Cas4 (RecB family)
VSKHATALRSKEATKSKGSARLSKSRYCLGVQCLKALYLKVHEPELAEEVDPAQQMIFDQGSAVGAEARTHYPRGVLIEFDYQQTNEALKATQEAILEKSPAIFEAAFIYKNILVRIDILKRNKNGTWDLIEVKSSTDIKDEHIPDVAIQRYVAEGAGLEISRTILKHINRECVFPDLKNLFVDIDCTELVAAELKSVTKKLKEISSALASESPPSVGIGPHCDAPYECSFKAMCWQHIPKHSIFELNGVWGKDKFELYQKGILRIADIDESVKVSRAKPQQLKAVQSNSPVIDKKGLKAFIQEIQYPSYFLDFETINPAIPQYPGMSPYAQLPFQFSCHILKKKNSEVEHIEYLASGFDDPRAELSERLLEVLGNKGTILAYNASFEKARINELSKHMRKFSKALLALLPRFIDLKDAFSKHYYHPDFHGSFSIKDVLPVLVPAMTYEGLGVNDGGGAQVAYLKLCDRATSIEQREKCRKDLLEYCKQDTLAMVRLFDQIKALINE